MDIKRVMKLHGVTFECLAAKMGQSSGTLSACIGKNGNPTLKKLETIAQHLGCSVADFFVEEDAMNGFVEYKGNVYRIRTKENLLHLLELVEANESKDDLTKK